MTTYLVTWRIEVDANSPLEAVREAHSCLPTDNNDSTATVFDVESLDEEGHRDGKACSSIDTAIPVKCSCGKTMQALLEDDTNLVKDEQGLTWHSFKKCHPHE